MWIYITLAIVLFIFLSVLLVAFISYRITFYSSLKNRGKLLELSPEEGDKDCGNLPKELIDGLSLFPYEEISITSFDGTKLCGKYYHTKDGAPLEIQFHGYRGSAARDLCGGTTLAIKSGHNVITVDQRAHGKSGGVTISFGINEKKDCHCWIDYAVKRFGKDLKILITGISMGASTVLMACNNEFPENVKGIISDCPYSSPEDIIRKVCREDMKLPDKLLFPFIKLGAKLFGSFNLSKNESAVFAVEKAKTPILLIHGEDDKFVPIEMSRKIYNSCPSKITFETFKGAGHGLSFITDNKRYEKIVNNFYKQIF